MNHAVFKALLFLGAGAFEQAVGSLELDRLGGLLRRMPWTGGAFLVGAMAIAGLPPLNGFASEWLTFQALLHVPAFGGFGAGIAGAVALAALAATAALAVFCFVKVVGLVLLGQPRTRERSPPRASRARPMRGRLLVFLALGCVVLGARCPVLLFGVARRACPLACLGIRRRSGWRLPGTGSLPTVGIAIVARRPHRRAACWPARAAARGAGPELGLRAAGRAASCSWTSAGFHQAAAARARGCSCAPSARSRSRSRRRRPAERLLHGACAAPDRRARSTGRLRALARRCARQARRLQSGSIGTYAAYLVALVLVLLVAARVGVLG